MQTKINVNGAISSPEEAKISVLDRGFLYGDSIYEVTSTRNGVLLYEDEHFERLRTSAELSYLDVGFDAAYLREEICKTIHAASPERGKDEVYVRYIITRGVGEIDLDPGNSSDNNFVIIVKKVPDWNPSFYSEGVKLAIPAVRRNSMHSLDPNIKGGNYLNNVLAVSQAKKLGGHDALMCNLDGHVAECSNSNIFFVMEGDLVTPSIDTGNLKGITRTKLLEICDRDGREYHEKVLVQEDLKKASECFISSATRGVMPVSELRLETGEWLSFPDGGGEVTKELQEKYKVGLDAYVAERRASAVF